MTPLKLALRFLGMTEITGARHHSFIRWCHSLCGLGHDQPDETPWCSSFVNAVCWMLDIPRSMSAAARSWLTVGRAVRLEDAVPGYTVVVLSRGTGPQPGPEVMKAPGHVGFFVGRENGQILVLGGNQGNAVSIARYPESRLLGIRDLSAVA